MENFIVSARKYRPSTFVSVVGQASITTTLKNAIKNNHLAHAYLFCGPRGVGKTTCARIFAKTINCTNIGDDFEACNECESCLGFNESRSYNIHELDAASNNSVEDIRNLIDQVRIPPQLGKYSLYIIDEVHMLSSAAFNAFLKTLEEPPAHARFILATTEKHKILPTILSRCQIFDFNRITVEDAANHLAYVAKSENIEVEPEALNVIAQKADGAMRDALSLFDQIVSFSGDKITYKGTIENLNVLDYDYYFKITDALIANKISDALLIFNDILNNGFDGHHFITGLSKHLRDLLVCMDNATIQLLEVGASIKENYKKQANSSPPIFLFEALEICNNCDIHYKGSKNQRLHVELTLVKLCNITNKKKKDEIEEDLEETSKSDKQNTKKASLADTSKQNTVRPTTVSIKDALNGDLKYKQKETTETVNEAKVEYETPKEIATANEFTAEQLLEQWVAFANKVKSPRVKAMLTNYKPELKKDFLVEFSINTKSLEEMFSKEIKTYLIQHLRKHFNNYQIEINSILIQEQAEKKPYTVADKYNYLTEKNPLLNTLKEEFNLDFN